ncbi:hypothetical protein JOF53_002953 [Crossiella equi]|uniref:DUF2752 domain-containing protein n=1 Tax=Crossiella equi TaxID=130796 RepID=A0ABS5ACK7_9PSEU|nr:DUF2752 domain-containing protein [Crossiella equi]MBP2474081.1 hypothetical protein [Crossiella equi]
MPLPALQRVLPPVAVLLAAAGGCAVVLAADPTTPGGVLPTCPTKLLFGIVCPGCGSLRMIYSLLHGRLGDALHYNAVGLLAVAVLVPTWLLWTANRARGRPHRSWTTLRWAPVVVLVITLAWFVVRNIPLAPFTALRV